MSDHHAEDEARWVALMRERHARGQEFVCTLADALRILAERDEARKALEESEADMHLRIRAGYDRTIADAWRARLAEVEAERDEALAEVERLRSERDEARAARLDALRRLADDADERLERAE